MKTFWRRWKPWRNMEKKINNSCREDKHLEIQRRFLKLYGALVYDTLEEIGFPHQALDRSIRPMAPHMMVAGLAYPIKGTTEVQKDRRELLMEMLGSMQEGCIAIMETGHDMVVAHWGELMTTAVRTRGCQGAVIDGGVRDSRYVLGMNFPVFHRYYTPVEANGRWGLVDYNTPICFPGNTIQQVAIFPGDYIFGDLDGVLVIPSRLTMEVLELAEERMSKETQVRHELVRGDSPLEVYRKYGIF